MIKNKLTPGLIAGILVALFFGVALYLRIYLPYDQVFVGDWIKFTGVDAYYHMRLVDNLVHNFPHHLTFDPCTFYTSGTIVPWPPFFEWLIAGTAWIAGLGSPTQHTVDVVGVYFPAVLGALVVIPVYFIGRELFNRWVGVIAACLVVLYPGEFLGRSILGFTDHHVAEVLLTTIAVLFLILALKSAKQRKLTFNHVRHWDWATIGRPLIYSLLTGVFIGVYLLTWVGGLLFVFIFFLYFVIQFIIDHLKDESTDYLGIVGTPLFLLSAIISLPFLPQTGFSRVYPPSFAVAVLAPVTLAIISRLMAGKKMKSGYYPLGLLGLGLAGLGIFYAASPTVLNSILELLKYFDPSMTSTTISTILEAQPLLFPGGDFSFSVAWGNFRTGFFLSFISLGILIYHIIKHGEADRTLFFVWSLVMLAATLGQRRFAYYFVVNVALLTGYLSWLILRFAGFKETAAEPVEAHGKPKRKARAKNVQRSGFRLTAGGVNMALGVIVVFFLAVFPSISPAVKTASGAHYAPSNAWCESLSWMEENTPDPSSSPDLYYETYSPRDSVEYPESAYGVLSWWDYGHWIERISHRMPVTNPFQQGVPAVARCLTAQDGASADELINNLDSKYIIIDHATATSKFHALPKWAGSSRENFYDNYYQLQDNRLVPVRLFHTDYYRSLAIRLYNFDGNEVTPTKTAVISYEEKVSSEGKTYKEITTSLAFQSYETAEEYIANQSSGNFRIVNNDPFVSPVPLEALENYRLIYGSDSSIAQPNGGMISEVKIFEYTKNN